MSARATRTTTRDGHDGHDRSPATTAGLTRPRAMPGPAPERDGSRAIDPRAVRVAVGPAMGHLDAPAVVIEPSEGPDGSMALVDGAPVEAVLDRLDAVRAVLRAAEPDQGSETDHDAQAGPVRVLLGPLERDAGDGRGVARREVVVDGWRVELELESERRAALRDRARRGRAEAAQGGPSEVRAIIPGRVVSVSVVPGDPVVASQQLLVVEAMKMQNELRAPREGTITRVAVAAGENIEVGDLLLVLE